MKVYRIYNNDEPQERVVWEDQSVNTCIQHQWLLKLAQLTHCHQHTSYITMMYIGISSGPSTQ